MTQLAIPWTVTRGDRPTIEQRWREWSRQNGHVLAEALRIAREWLARGDRYISTKAILEVLRVTVSTTSEGGYRINNDFSRPLAQWLCDQEPQMKNVLRMRSRK